MCNNCEPSKPRQPSVLFRDGCTHEHCNAGFNAAMGFCIYDTSGNRHLDHHPVTGEWSDSYAEDPALEEKADAIWRECDCPDDLPGKCTHDEQVDALYTAAGYDPALRTFWSDFMEKTGLDQTWDTEYSTYNFIGGGGNNIWSWGEGLWGDQIISLLRIAHYYHWEDVPLITEKEDSL